MGSCSFVAFEKFIRPYWHQIVLEIMLPPIQKASVFKHFRVDGGPKHIKEYPFANENTFLWT